MAIFGFTAAGKTNPNKANFQTESQSGFDIGRAENLQKETVQMFDKRLKTAKNIIWGSVAMGVAFELVGLAGLIAGLAGKLGTNTMIFCAVLTLSGAHLPLVAKLLYAGTNIELHVLKELKQIQLEIAELAGKNPPAEN